MDGADADAPGPVRAGPVSAPACSLVADFCGAGVDFFAGDCSVGDFSVGDFCAAGFFSGAEPLLPFDCVSGALSEPDPLSPGS